MKDFGIDVKPLHESLSFQFGEGVSGPKTEIRKLKDIRKLLMDKQAKGPEEVYGIAMDVYREKDREILIERNLLFGAVTYNKGKIGNEPVRSQGHIHTISSSCGASTCEVYEIWEGEAYIYMQPFVGNDAGICQAVFAKAGDVVVVPPGWVHATVNANSKSYMTFAAWCVRDYGFEYEELQKYGGIAFFPVIINDVIHWKFNSEYQWGKLKKMQARTYPELGIETNIPIYQQFINDPDRFLFVAQPILAKKVWEDMRNENERTQNDSTI